MVEKVKKKKCFWSWAQKELIMGDLLSHINVKVESPKAIRSYMLRVLTSDAVKPIDNRLINQLYQSTFNMKFVQDKGAEVFTKGAFITLLNRFFGIGNYANELEHPLRVALMDKLIGAMPTSVVVVKPELTPKPVIKKVSDLVPGAVIVETGMHQYQLIPGIAVTSDSLLAFARANLDTFVKFCVAHKS